MYLCIAVRERKTGPGHFIVVLLERRLVSVRADEDDHELRIFGIFEELCKLWCEAAAGRAPMGGEVDAWKSREWCQQ